MAPSCPLNCENFGNKCTKHTINNPGCYCRSGYVLNCEGKCVSAQMYCQSCLINEYYSDCGQSPEPSCQSQTLSTNNTVKGCICKHGFIRNYDGVCIAPRDCPFCNDINAEYSNMAPACPLDCETLGNSCTNRTVNKQGCVCKNGFVKNCEGACVLANDYCEVCSMNEFYTDCGHIPEATCLNPLQISQRTAPGCVCRNGYILDFNNKCIPQSQCPKCNDTNSEYSNFAPSCRLTCENLDDVCTQRTTNNSGCYCKPGFVLNCDDLCVPIMSYCRRCPLNEYYTECGASPEASCQNPNISTNAYLPGCICKSGYIRHYNGQCVLPNQCPVCFDTNAEYSNYAPICNVTCETYNTPCTQRSIMQSGCQCKMGFVQNCEGLCVLESSYCHPCNVTNSFYSDCAKVPEKSCQNRTIESTGTTPGCSCAKGYIRDYDGSCVIPKDCPGEIYLICQNDF